MEYTNVILLLIDTAFFSLFAKLTRYEIFIYIFFTFPEEKTLNPNGFRLQKPGKFVKLTNTWPGCQTVSGQLKAFAASKLSVDKTIIFLTCDINYVLPEKYNNAIV